MKWLFALFATVFLSSSIVLFLNSSASAATIYDDVYRTTDKLEVADGCDVQDITQDWYTIIQESSVDSSYKTSLASAVLSGGRWGVSQSTSGSVKTVQVFWTEDTSLYLDWDVSPGTAVYAKGDNAKRILINYPSWYSCDYYVQGALLNHWNDQPLSTDTSGNLTNLFVYTDYLNYPTGYAGLDIPDTWSPPGADGELVPDYSWKVSADGELNVKYMDNLPHFLTGTAYVVVEKMNDNWDGIDENLTSITETPAGWMDSKYTLPGAGYYMVRIDHNQQLDEPPWPEDSNFSVKQRWIQFRWDGHSPINGTTVGCTDDICNVDRNEDNKTASIFSSLDNIETFGLTSFITAPITFLQTLPSKVSTCSPISFPLMGHTVSLECLSSRYWSWSSTVMTIITTIWIGSVAYVVALSIFRIIKDVNSPHKDQIETVKL